MAENGYPSAGPSSSFLKRLGEACAGLCGLSVVDSLELERLALSTAKDQNGDSQKPVQQANSQVRAELSSPADKHRARLAALEAQKQDAISREDFIEAQRIKKDIEALHRQVQVVEVDFIKLAYPSAPLLPQRRLPKPHEFFPFDIFSSAHAPRLLEDGERLGMTPQLVRELEYVRDHCMTPPFPWGHIMYRSFINGNVIQAGIPGDFAELGTGLGGTSVFLARLAKQHGRKLLAVDSFEGLPEPDLNNKDNHYFVEGDYRPKNGVDQLQAWLQYKKGFDIDDVLYTEKAFFKDLVIPPVFDKFAFVHLDSDLYDSVYDSLEKVWDRVSVGGAVAIDDFFHHAQGPARAVSDFFRKRGNPEGEPPLLYVVPTYAVLIIKGRSAWLEYARNGNSASSDGGPRRGTMHSPRALDGNYYSFKFPRMCQPFVQAVEESARKAAEACADEGYTRADREKINRARLNAEAFLAFLKYPDEGVRSGSDIYRFLLPLEDQWDMCQGTLCGLAGQERNTIEIKI